jgi:ribosomal protein S12 methylthiotransferase accessory factor
MEEFAARIARAVDPATGIVKYLHPVRFYASDPDYFCYNSIVASAERFSGLAPNSQVNAGIGTTQTLARLAAIGECLERYSSALYEESGLVRASYVELCRDYPAENILAPNDIELFGESQYRQPDFPFVRFHEKITTFWTWTYCLIQKRPMLTPATFVFMPYVVRSREENCTYTTSTGLAFSHSLESAILAAIYEVVERDALMITWYNRLSRPKIALNDVPLQVKEYLDRHYTMFGQHRLHCMNITSDIGIPVIFTVVTGKGIETEPALAVGAASRLNPLDAFYKSLMEGFQTFNWARFLKRSKTAKDELGEFRVVSFEQHVQHYTRDENYAKAEFSFASPEQVKLQDMPNLDRGTICGNIEAATQQIRAAGCKHLLVKELTSADVAELGGHVARVVIPKTVPLNLGNQRLFLGVRRMFEVPYRMGLLPSPTMPDSLNPAPHPFP